ERGGKLRSQRSRAPVCNYRLPDLLTERVRRNCAVGAHSERTLVEQRGEGGEQLPLPRAPVRRPPHDAVELIGERMPEELGPVEERLHPPEGLGAAPLADGVEHRRLGRRVPTVDDG